MIPDCICDISIILSADSQEQNVYLYWFSSYETIGGLFREVTRNFVELTITGRIWGMIIDIVKEIALCFKIEDEKIFETLINRSDRLQHFIQIYELKKAS